MNLNAIFLTIICLSLIHSSNQRLLIRKNAENMSSKQWESYRRAIRVLKERSYANVYDPTGFIYQSNLHAWPPYDGSEQANKIIERYGWHSCQHIQYFTYPWHRMYMYFYERILRKAAKDPNLTIPYWDYSGSVRSQALPEALRIPADESLNPLYLCARCEAINRGMPLRPEVTDPYGGLRSRFYAIDKTGNELNVCHSFAGGRVDKPTFFGGSPGLLDRIPHFIVHLFVGGVNGIMSNACKTALDPAFMLHHAQLDRIWESWLRLGGLLPNDNKFLDQTFDFFDENGRRVSPRVRDFINLTKLETKYENYIEANKIVPVHSEPELFIDVEEANKDNKLALNYKMGSILIQLKDKTIQLFEDLANDRKYLSKARFTLQFDVHLIDPSNYFDIYLNLNAQTLPYNQNPYYIGSMVMFNHKCVPLKTKIVKRGEVTNCFDITTKLRQIVKNDYNLNGFVSKQLNITFIARDCYDNYYTNSSEIMVSFNLIVLCHIFDE